MDWNIFITRRIPQPGIDLLKPFCSRIDINPLDRPLTRDEILDGVKGRDGVICLLTDTIDEDIFKASEGCRIFANYAVGYNNIDVPAATKRNILVTNTPGVLTEATADLTWALIFSTARRIPESERFTRGGKFEGWDSMLLLGADIYGKTLGIVGTGRIGTAVAMRSMGFKMRVLYTDAKQNNIMEKNLNAEKVDLGTLLKESDFVSLHVPLTPETIRLIRERELNLMKKTAFLINTSRGSVIQEDALATALKKKTIAGAGLDVYEKEPEIHPDLMELDNVVLLPHIGSATVTARTRMATMAAENLLAGLKGERPLNLINPEALKK